MCCALSICLSRLNFTATQWGRCYFTPILQMNKPRLKKFAVIPRWITYVALTSESILKITYSKYHMLVHKLLWEYYKNNKNVICRFFACQVAHESSETLLWAARNPLTWSEVPFPYRSNFKFCNLINKYSQTFYFQVKSTFQMTTCR